MSYAVITPVRDEAEFIGKTIRSMIRQTIRPVEWVITVEMALRSVGTSV